MVRYPFRRMTEAFYQTTGINQQMNNSLGVEIKLSTKLRMTGTFFIHFPFMPTFKPNLKTNKI